MLHIEQPHEFHVLWYGSFMCTCVYATLLAQWFQSFTDELIVITELISTKKAFVHLQLWTINKSENYKFIYEAFKNYMIYQLFSLSPEYAEQIFTFYIRWAISHCFIDTELLFLTRT